MAFRLLLLRFITAPAAPRGVGRGAPARREHGAGKTTHAPVWDKPQFPRAVRASVVTATSPNVCGVTTRTCFTPRTTSFAPLYAETAKKEFEFFSSQFGPPLSTDLNIVELPDDTVPSAWAPEIAGLASRAISEKTNYRLLANAIAHQWWGVSVSPYTRDDFWLQDGFARYSEIRYVEHAAGSAGFEEATKDIAVGALAYDTIPLSSAGKLDMFSPEFQSLTSDKGAMILHMLRWEVGNATFDKLMRTFATQSFGKSERGEDFAKVAEAVSGTNLTPFFAQWLDGTGAPEFKNKYSVYRIAKGFRVVGEVSQDLDLFR